MTKSKIQKTQALQRTKGIYRMISYRLGDNSAAAEGGQFRRKKGDNSAAAANVENLQKWPRIVGVSGSVTQ
jgi:hypothetical protein